LCLVSQFGPGVRTKHSERIGGFDILIQHVRRFCESHGSSLCVPLKYRDPKSSSWEREYFETRLGDYAQIVPRDAATYGTYALVDCSRVSIGMHTTVLREGFGRGNRILSCNFSGNPVYDFAAPGPWSLSDPAYEAFEQRLLWLLNAPEPEYAQARRDRPAYLIGYDEAMPTHVFLQNLIADAVRGAAEPQAAFSAEEIHSV
jgi:hypothetical protein